jgi:hypothetical protein
MFRIAAAFALLAPASALACPGSAKADGAAMASTASADPTHCAQNAELVGSCCSYSTNMMAQRVNEEGAATTLTAQLTRTADLLASKVAAPWTVGDYRVIANSVMEQIDTSRAVSVQGKVLAVDGVKYLLVTSAAPTNS